MNQVRKRLFITLIENFEKNNIRYAVLGRTETYPEYINSDIDIVVLNRDLSRCVEVLRNLNQQGLRLVQLLQHEPTGYYFVLNFQDKEQSSFVIPDICTDYLRNGKRFFTADYLLKNARLAKDHDGNDKGFRILSPEREFMYYFSKKIDKDELESIHFEHLFKQWNQNSIACTNELGKFFTAKNALLISSAFKNESLKDLKTNIDILQSDFEKSKKFNFIDALKKYLTKVNRILKPTGVFVVFMGPDGSGKTSVINVVKQEMAPAFRKTTQYHLFPVPTKGKSKATEDPHSSKPRNFFGSMLKLVYLTALYNKGYFKLIYSALVRSTFVVFDRYYHDILVDPIRYRNGTSSVWVKVFGYFIPKPNLWILLDVPADELQRRKQEVPFEESERQREAYLQLFSNLKNAHIIDGNQELGHVCLEVQDVILNHLQKRTLRRIKGL